MYANFQRETAAMTPRSLAGPGHGFFAAAGRLMEALVRAHARHLPPPNRELPPEWFRYPIV